MANNELKGKLSLDVSDFDKKLKDAEQKGTKLEGALSGIKLDVDTSGVDKNLKNVETAAKKVAENTKKAFEEASKPTVDVKIGVAGSEKAKKDAEAVGKDVGDNFNKGADNTIKGINTSKVFNTAVIANTVNTLNDTFQSSIQPFVNYNKQLADLSAITGVSGGGLNDLGQKARDLALQFGGTASEQIESFKGVLSRLGPDIAKSPEALNKMAIAINTVSKASGLDATTSMDALTTSALQFGVDLSNPITAANEMTKQMNVLAAGAKFGAAEIPQVAEAVKVAGVAAYGANISFEETNAAIQAMATGGKFGAEAGTALRNVISLLQKPSAESAKTLNQMGLSASELGEMITKKGIAATMEKLKGGINTLGSDAQKNAAMIQLFGQENAAAATIMMRNSDSITTMTKQMTGTNTATEQAAINMNTFAFKAEQAKAKFEDMAIGVGSAIGNFGMAVGSGMMKASKVITAGMQIQSLIPEALYKNEQGKFVGFTNTLKNTYQSVASVASSVGGGITTAFKTVTSGTGNLVSSLLQKVVPSFFVTSTAIGATGATATTTAFSFGAMWTAITGPVGLVVGAIALVGAAFVGLYKYCEPFRNFIDNLWEQIKNFGASAINVFSNLFPPIKFVVSLIDTLISGFKRASSVSIFLKGIMGGLGAAFSEVGNSMKALWDGITSLDFGKMSNALSNMGGNIANAFKNGMDSTINQANAAQKQQEVVEQKQAESAKKQEAITNAATNNIIANDKKKSESAKKATTDILSNYTKEAEALQKNLDLSEQKAENARLEAGLTKTNQDQLSTETAKLSLLEKQKNMLNEIITLNGGKMNEKGIIVGSKLNSEDKEKLQKEMVKVVGEIEKQQIVADGVSIKVKLDNKSITESEAKAQIELDKRQLSIDLKAGVITEVIFEEKSKGLLQKELDLMLAKQSELTAKLSTVQGTTNAESVRTELNNLVKDVESKQKEISEANKKIQIAAIKSISDLNKQRLELQKLELETERDERLKGVKGNADAEYEVEKDYYKKLGQLRSEYNDSKMTFSEKLVKNMSTSLVAAFSTMKFDLGGDTSQIDAVKAEQDALRAEYASGELNYKAYITKMNELDAKRAEAVRNSTTSTQGFWKSVNGSLGTMFGEMSQTYYNSSREVMENRAKLIDMVNQLEEKQAGIADKNSAEYIAAQNAKVEASKGAGDAMNSIYAQMGVAMTASFTSMVAQGKSAWKALILSLLQGLQVMVPIWSAQILGGSLATPQSIMSAGGWGLAQWAAMTAILQGGVSLAQAAVSRMKFAKGGEKTLGNFGTGLIKTQQMALVSVAEENNPEYVINSKATKKHTDLLAWINANKDPRDFYNSQNLAIYNKSDNSNLERQIIGLRADLQNMTFENRIETKNNIKVQMVNDVISEVKKIPLHRS